VAPVIIVVDNDKDEEDNGVIPSGVSTIVGIVPVVFVVNGDNGNEGDGIIFLRMALLEPKKLGLSDFSSDSPTFPPLAWRTRRPCPKNVMRCGPKCNVFVASLRNRADW
jgi:hypothetical protein